MIIYLNGEFLPKSEAAISPDDRGFLLADGIYEVLRVYRGCLFEPDAHWQRLARSLREIRIDPPAGTDWTGLSMRLLQQNQLERRDASIYIQVTRGVAPRNHAFPQPAGPPTVYAAADPVDDPNAGPAGSSKWESGAGIQLVPDVRWLRCDIKAVGLLPNVLASQQALEAGADEAVFVRDRAVTEGARTNFAAVFDGCLHTHPANHLILPGITRAVVLRLCAALGVAVVQRPIPETDLAQADEMMLLGTRSEVMPVVRVNTRAVGNGKPGSVTHKLQAAFRAHIEATTR